MRFVPALFLFAMSTVTDIEWSERQPMPRAQAGGAAAYLDGDVVVAGGTTWIGDVKTWLSDVQIYNPASNTWRSGPKLPAPMAYGPFVSSATELEIFGGSDGQTAQRDSWKLNAAKTKWVRTGSIPADALLGRAARVGESVFLFGGCRDVVDLNHVLRCRLAAEGKRRVAARVDDTWRSARACGRCRLGLCCLSVRRLFDGRERKGG